MNDRLKEMIIKKILEHVPSTIKSANYLTDTLDLAKESVYRRLNGQIDFTTEEIIKLSKKLNFSLDEILSEYNNDLAIFTYTSDRLNSVKNESLELLKQNVNIMKDASKDKNNVIFVSMNYLLTMYVHEYEYLARFAYFKTLHQFENVPFNYYLRDLIIPEEIIILNKEIIKNNKQLNYKIIFDKYTIYNTIQDIKYFYERGLIKHEIPLLVDDLKKFLNNIQVILTTGKYHESTWEMYLSSINIDSNSCYMMYNNIPSSFFWIHSDSGIHTKNTQICNLEKEWFYSLLKYSTLISKSNQKMQADFLNEQYKYLEELI